MTATSQSVASFSAPATEKRSGEANAEKVRARSLLQIVEAAAGTLRRLHLSPRHPGAAARRRLRRRGGCHYEPEESLQPPRPTRTQSRRLPLPHPSHCSQTAQIMHEYRKGLFLLHRVFIKTSFFSFITLNRGHHTKKNLDELYSNGLAMKFLSDLSTDYRRQGRY